MMFQGQQLGQKLQGFSDVHVSRWSQRKKPLSQTVFWMEMLFFSSEVIP
jgi:hypothetical protein